MQKESIISMKFMLITLKRLKDVLLLKKKERKRKMLPYHAWPEQLNDKGIQHKNLERLCTTKETIKRAKKQPTGENIFKPYIG